MRLFFHRALRSQILPGERDVIVAVPSDYESAPLLRYPVLYMHDGQNLFDGRTSFIPGQAWQIQDTAQSLINRRKIAPLILVGIYNAGESRIEEYTPTRVGERGGFADLYGQMLVEELKPFIDFQYRTRPERTHTGLGGSSLGGLVSLYLGIRHARTFSRVAAMSPSAWWDNKAIVRLVEALPEKLPLQIWLDIGASEGERIVADVRSLRDALIAQGWESGYDLSYLEARHDRHTEKSWGKRFGRVLRFLYSRRAHGVRAAYQSSGDGSSASSA